MKNKQIIILILVIFLAFVGYKVISSNVQENKEKAVLQEQARLKELEKEPLNKCINDIETNVNSYRKNDTTLTYTILSREYQDCMKPTGHGAARDLMIAAGKFNLQDYCAPPTSQEVELEKQKILNEEQIAKDECYKRYK